MVCHFFLVVWRDTEVVVSCGKLREIQGGWGGDWRREGNERGIGGGREKKRARARAKAKARARATLKNTLCIHEYMQTYAYTRVCIHEYIYMSIHTHTAKHKKI